VACECFAQVAREKAAQESLILNWLDCATDS
jgi:hypothetical protein